MRESATSAFLHWSDCCCFGYVVSICRDLFSTAAAGCWQPVPACWSEIQLWGKVGLEGEDSREAATCLSPVPTSTSCTGLLGVGTTCVWEPLGHIPES